MERRRPSPRGVGPVMREEDFMVAPDYGRIYGPDLRPGINTYQPGDLAPQTLELRNERENNDWGAEVRRRRALPQRLAKGGVVRGDGCCKRGKTKGKMR